MSNEQLDKNHGLATGTQEDDRKKINKNMQN
jgi:hypothetical protein